jgi:bifunctional non-homologous end joining protein LigD
MLMRTSPRLARDRRRPEGFIPTSQPVLHTEVPTGPEWIHELKHDGFRILARKDGDRVRLWSRQGVEWTKAFPAITAAVAALPVESVILDGEAMAHCEEGLPDFNRLLSAERAGACYFAFDLLMVDGEDLRLCPLEERRTRLMSIFQTNKSGEEIDTAIRLSEHMEGPDGPALFRHACAMNLEGIVSKRKDRAYKSGRCPHWRKIKNPDYARP